MREKKRYFVRYIPCIKQDNTKDLGEEFGIVVQDNHVYYDSHQAGVTPAIGTHRYIKKTREVLQTRHDDFLIFFAFCGWLMYIRPKLAD